MVTIGSMIQNRENTKFTPFSIGLRVSNDQLTKQSSGTLLEDLYANELIDMIDSDGTIYSFKDFGVKKMGFEQDEVVSLHRYLYILQRVIYNYQLNDVIVRSKQIFDGAFDQTRVDVIERARMMKRMYNPMEHGRPAECLSCYRLLYKNIVHVFV